MIYWVADEVVYSLATSQFVIIDEVIIWPPAVELRTPAVENEAQIEQIKRLSGVAKGRSLLHGAVTAPFFIARRRNGAVHYCTAPFFAVGCRSLPYFSAHGPTYTLCQKIVRLVPVVGAVATPTIPAVNLLV
jgi:hypothetical protein